MRETHHEENGALKWMRINETENAIDDLEIGAQFAGASDYDYRWKWIALSLFHSLYGFLIIALGGSSNYERVQQPLSVRVKKKLEKGELSDDEKRAMVERNLISFREALNRACMPEYMSPYVHSQPLALSEEQKKNLDRLREELRNNFAHFLPKQWSINIVFYLEVFKDAVDVLESLIFQTNNVWLNEEQQQRVRTAIANIRLALSLEAGTSSDLKPY